MKLPRNLTGAELIHALKKSAIRLPGSLAAIYVWPARHPNRITSLSPCIIRLASARYAILADVVAHHGLSRERPIQLLFRHETLFDLPAETSMPVELALPAPRRGWLDSGQLVLQTRFPLGLFKAWTYLHFDVRALVYPKPTAPQPLPAASAQDGSGKNMVKGDDDFFGLRSYVAGDAMPHIAWKALAREQGLQVKQFSAMHGQELWLDWACLPNVSQERKLELLTRWVLDAEAKGLRYGLRLPGSEIPPRHGSSHRAECLRRLALFEIRRA